jgi:hypothetical protein
MSVHNHPLEWAKEMNRLMTIGEMNKDNYLTNCANAVVFVTETAKCLAESQKREQEWREAIARLCPYLHHETNCTNYRQDNMPCDCGLNEKWVFACNLLSEDEPTTTQIRRKGKMTNPDDSKVLLEESVQRLVAESYNKTGRIEVLEAALLAERKENAMLSELCDILKQSRVRGLNSKLPMLMELPLTKEEYDRIETILNKEAK